jgi:hypothetical protein
MKHTGRRTRKAGAVTIEGLHASFEKIDKKVATMIAKGQTDAELTCCIRKAWSEQFHMGLSMPAIKGMIVHYRALHKGDGKRKTRKSRGQTGGMAPMDWIMGQGITDKVYGEFPVEMGTSALVSKGLDLGRFYESDGGRVCDSTGGHPAPGQPGSPFPLKGGGVLDAIGMGHAPASVPRNVLEIGTGAIQGVAGAGGPSSSPVTYQPSSVGYSPKAFDASALSSIASLAPIYKGY